MTAELIAHNELKKKIVELMFEFTDKYASPSSNIYPQCKDILVEVLTECLSEAQYQSGSYFPFTKRQVDHICYQIGEWYHEWKYKMIHWDDKSHRLGYAKEQLKIMICGKGEGL